MSDLGKMDETIRNCTIYREQVAAEERRGLMGGGGVGGGDPDDADREEQPVAAWIAETKTTGVLDFVALERAAEKEIEPYLDALADEVGKREEMIRELHGQLSCLCAAIETHPMGQENDFVRNERERARKLLGHYDVSEMAKPVLRHWDGCTGKCCKGR